MLGQQVDIHTHSRTLVLRAQVIRQEAPKEVFCMVCIFLAVQWAL